MLYYWIELFFFWEGQSFTTLLSYFEEAVSNANEQENKSSQFSIGVFSLPPFVLYFRTRWSGVCDDWPFLVMRTNDISSWLVQWTNFIVVHLSTFSVFSYKQQTRFAGHFLFLLKQDCHCIVALILVLSKFSQWMQWAHCSFLDRGRRLSRMTRIWNKYGGTAKVQLWFE